MDRAREVASTTLGLRKARGLRVRQPLPSLTVVAAEPTELAAFADVVADEVNVKSVRLLALDDPEAAPLGVTQRLTVNARAAGPAAGQGRAGRRSGRARPATGGSRTTAGRLRRAGAARGRVHPRDGGRGRRRGDEAVAVLPSGGFVVLDLEVTPELAREGVARDLVRAVQQVRRDAGLAVGDRIVLTLASDDPAVAAAARPTATCSRARPWPSTAAPAAADADLDGRTAPRRRPSATGTRWWWPSRGAAERPAGARPNVTVRVCPANAFTRGASVCYWWTVKRGGPSGVLGAAVAASAWAAAGRPRARRRRRRRPPHAVRRRHGAGATAHVHRAGPCDLGRARRRRAHAGGGGCGDPSSTAVKDGKPIVVQLPPAAPFTVGKISKSMWLHPAVSDPAWRL